MRTLILLGAGAIGLAALGVIKFQKNGDQVNISIDENKLHHVESEVIEESQQVVNEAEKAVQQEARAGQTDSSSQQ
jgi:threonine dehydrogenase-like Zn-dependent dehydrogenase